MPKHSQEQPPSSGGSSELFDKSAFGPTLQRARKAQGLTQIDLSERASLSKSYISFLESGVRHPSREVVLRLAEVLGPDNAELRAQFLTLAGFSPQSSTVQNGQDFLPQELGFSDFMQYVLGLIRAQEYKRAQRELEGGFQRFNQPAQMQTLLAHLELAREQYQQAILLQKTALEYLSLDAQVPIMVQVEFSLNLGVMYFLWGDQSRFSEENIPQALQRYDLALQAFEQGLKRQSDHLYLLDEVGRLHFNLADLLDPPESTHHWEESIRAFRAVLGHGQKEQLKPEVLIESSAFLALAYAKTQDFNSAELLIEALTLAEQNHWLLPYIQACIACLHAQEEPQGPWLARAKQALERALARDPSVLRQAQADQGADLAPLARAYPDLFKEKVEEAG